MLAKNRRVGLVDGKLTARTFINSCHTLLGTSAPSGAEEDKNRREVLYGGVYHLRSRRSWDSS